MRFLVEPVWSWPWVLVAAVAMIATVLVTYPPRVRHISPGWRRGLIALRLCGALLLIFAMLRPSLEFSEKDSQRAELLVLTDTSRSMTTPDGPGGLTRRQELLETLSGASEELEALSDDVDIRYYDFAEDIAGVEEPADTADGKFTAIGKILDAIREQETGRRIVGVVLMSDGAQRAGGDDDIDARGAARRFAEERGIPIHTVTFGTSELAQAGLDLVLEDLSIDQPVTFERKTVPVRLQVRLLGAAGRDVKVRLLLEDRTGKTAGETGELTEIPLSGDAVPFKTIRTNENSARIPVELSFVAERSGEYKIAAEVVPADGEVKTTNNRLESLITVRKGGLKVAYFDVPRPEQKFLRALNRTAKIQLDLQVVLPGRLAERTRIDPKLFEPNAYDVYLIGDVPASVFQQSGADLLARLGQRVNEGAGLGMLGGLHNYGAGGYASTPLKFLLPVRMTPGEEVPLGAEAPQQHHMRPLRMLPTRDGERHYLMRLSGQGNRDLWRQLPELGGANRLVPKSGAVEVLAESATGDPLLIAGDSGRGRVLALAVDETWKWHLHGYSAEHQRFWQQLVLWLAHKEFDADQQVWVRVEPRNFPPLAKVPLEFGARDPDGNPIPDADYEVEIIRPDGEIETANVQRIDQHGLSEFTDTEQAGDYWVRVAAQHDGASVGLSAMTRFIVDARDLEMDNPAADPDQMAEIASLTGTTMVAPEDFAEFIEGLAESGLAADLMRYRRINLWDGWPFLLLFIGVVTLEWTLRKWRGLV